MKAKPETQRIGKFDVFDDAPGEIRVSTVDAWFQDSDCYALSPEGFNSRR